MADWNKILSRGDVEDRRSSVGLAGGGLSAMLVAGSIIFSLVTGQGIDIGQLLSLLASTTGTNSSLTSDDFAGADKYETFASTVLGSTNDFWGSRVASGAQQYTKPKLVLFRNATPSGCGVATSDVGPHYCPKDQTIYLDETFFDELQAKFNAKGGDVAEAYVIAHEVGHHVQNIDGTMNKVTGSNEDSIALELQADCYAGAWAKSVSTAGVFEPNEINEALDAASAVGDDRIQSKVTGQINPETWTHGSSQQRVQWFNTGFTTGDPARCSTFNS